ncbi:hypothetical protein J6590_087239 [Homalodisca vitripennis]|nr:hypothetical protein J6590_087239 [Homalodisca vitripennis]
MREKVGTVGGLRKVTHTGVGSLELEIAIKAKVITRRVRSVEARAAGHSTHMNMISPKFIDDCSGFSELQLNSTLRCFNTVRLRLHPGVAKAAGWGPIVCVLACDQTSVYDGERSGKTGVESQQCGCRRSYSASTVSESVHTVAAHRVEVVCAGNTIPIHLSRPVFIYN